MTQKIVPDSIANWLQNLDKAGDKLLLRRTFVDLCDGDHLAAIIFGQLLYYHLPDHKGAGTKLRVRKNGALWVAKKYNDWQEECRINEHTARKKIDRLKATGLVLTRNFMFKGLKVLHLRIDFECMAARLAALPTANGIRPDRPDPESHDRSDRSVPPGQTDLSSPDEPITETTSDTTDKNDTPQPSPDGEGAFSICPGLDFTNETLGTSGNTDWLMMTTRHDRVAADAVSRLFPADPNTPLTSKDVARKFVKRRRGVLGGNAAMVLARWFPHARFEGQDAPAWRHAKTFSQLLDVKLLTPALDACRVAAGERLAEIDSMVDTATSFELGMQQLGYLEKFVEPGMDLVAFCLGRLDLPAVCTTAWRKRSPGLPDVHRSYKEAILGALVDERYWIEIHGENCANVFGIDHEEIRAAQNAYWKPIEAEREAIIAMLK